MKIRVTTTQPGSFVEEVECESYIVHSTERLWIYFEPNRIGRSQEWTHRYGSKTTWVIEELDG